MNTQLIFFWAFLVALPTLGAEQTKTQPQYYTPKTLADMSSLQSTALESDYALEQTRHLANNIGPRLSGSPGAQRAVEYVAGEMRKLGLEVTLQKVMVPHWVRGVETGQIVESVGMAKGSTQKIVLTALGSSAATPEKGLTAEVVVVANFDELEALGRKNVEGKIVLFNNRFDVEMQTSGYGEQSYDQASAYRFFGPQNASKLGAVAALVRSAGGSQNRLPHTGMTVFPEGVKKIPAAAVTYEDAELISSMVSQGKTRVHLTLTPKTYPDVESYNVIGDLKGSEKPDEIVVVGGHLDSWDLATGALDDGCGVAVSLQVVQLIKKLNLKPKRTIRVIAFMSEEVGAIGGKAYFKANEANVEKHFAAIESDIGASHPLGFVFVGKEEAVPMLEPISKVLLKQGAWVIRPSDEAGADIDRLTKAKVPSFAPFLNMQTYFKYHHTPADTFDKIDPKELAQVGSVMAVLTYGLANLEVPLPR